MSDNSESVNVNVVQNQTTTSVNESKSGNGMFKVLLIDECSAHDIPKALKTLMSSLVDPTITDITVVLLYIMTVETGFIPSCCEPLQGDSSRHYDIRRLNVLTEMPPDWKTSDEKYKLSFFLQPFKNRECILICSQTLNQLSVSMFFCDTSDVLQTFSMLVNPTEFIDCKSSFPKSYVFKNLKRLSVNFKNKLPLAVRSCIWDKTGFNDRLLALPVELLDKIFDYLPPKSFLRLTSTCKFLYDSFGNDNVFWKKLVIREFGNIFYVSQEDHVHWKEFFKLESEARRKKSSLSQFNYDPCAGYSFCFEINKRS